ncbi:MAG: hypothetical protein ACREBQ_13585, partial [Nitrososphaerales archaeon]
MTEDSSLTAPQLEGIAKRALTFQRHIFRRAWGTYYALWSVAFAVFAFGNELPLQTLVPQNLAWIPYIVMDVGVGLAAGIATAWIFNKAHRTISLERIVMTDQGMGGRRYSLIWIWWLGFYVIAFLSFSVFPKGALSILYAMLFAVVIFIYYTLKLSFQSKTPLEGKLALASYGSCVIISF